MAPFRGFYGGEQMVAEGQSIIDILAQLLPAMQKPGTGGLFDEPLQPDPYSPGSDAARRRDPIGPYAPLVVGRPETPAVPPYPPRWKKLITDQILPYDEAPVVDDTVPGDVGPTPRMPPPAVAPYPGTGGNETAGYNPQDTTGPDVPASEGAPPEPGAATAPATGNNMDALMQALAGLQAPPSNRQQVSVATPPPPRAAPGGGNDLLAAILALGGMGKGGSVPSLGSFIK